MLLKKGDVFLIAEPQALGKITGKNLQVASECDNLELPGVKQFQILEVNRILHEKRQFLEGSLFYINTKDSRLFGRQY